MWTENLQMSKWDLEKAEEPEIKLPNPLDHRKSKRIPEKHLLLFHWLHQSLWLCRSQQTGKFLKRWEYQTTWPASWEICIQVKKQHLELDMEQQTGSKSGKEYVKAVYCLPDYLTSMQSTSWEMLVWRKQKTPPKGRKQRGTKEPLDESERGEWKSWLKTQHSNKWRLWHLVPSLHGK